MAFLSMLIASGTFWLLRHAFHLSAGGIFMAVGILTLPISAVLFALSTFRKPTQAD
jgi:hypothetical protein